MERTGLHLDRAAHALLVEEWSQELADARQKYVSITGNTPPETDEKTREWLSQVLSPEELAGWKRTKTGKQCVEHDAIMQLGHIPEARPLLDIRAKERLLATFGMSLADKISPATGRIHGSFLI